jgi:hypothetical protein
MFTVLRQVLPRLAWSAAMPPVRVLELFAVGATDDRATLVGIVLDGLLAVMVVHQRSSTSARGALQARLAAMARFAPVLANVLDGVPPVPGQEIDSAP